MPQDVQLFGISSAYVSGMFVESAHWDSSTGMLAESEPKVGWVVGCSWTQQLCVLKWQSQGWLVQQSQPVYRMQHRSGQA